MTTTVTDRDRASVDGGGELDVELGWGPRIKAAISPAKIAGIYVLLLMIVLFSIWEPDTFPEADTVRQILNNYAIDAMVALTLVIPLSAGVFDISVPYTMTLSGVMATYAIVNSGLPIGVAILLALGVSLLVGIVNGVVVVVFKIESLIATLATGFLVQAMIQWRTGSRNISGAELSGTFQDIAQKDVAWNLTRPVFYAVIMAAAIWYVMEHTATGRRIYATGFNRDASRLASVRTDRLQFGCLIVSSLLAGITGLVLASNLGSGSPTAGNLYLLPAFAAVFLGATQLKSGRFNAWGTIIAVLMLGTGRTGLALAEVDEWIRDVFVGLVLITALALTVFEVRRAGGAARRAGAKEAAAAAVAEDGATPAPVSEIT
jgi:ribose transport system permease protein